MLEVKYHCLHFAVDQTRSEKLDLDERKGRCMQEKSYSDARSMCKGRGQNLGLFKYKYLLFQRIFNKNQKTR